MWSRIIFFHDSKSLKKRENTTKTDNEKILKTRGAYSNKAKANTYAVGGMENGTGN